MFRLFCLCRSCLQVLLLLAVIGTICGLVYLNEKGFPGAWGDRVQDELERRGMNVEFSTLQYNLVDGVVGRDVSFFSDEGKLLLTAKKVKIDVDKTKALRGKIQLREFAVEGGQAFYDILDEPENLVLSDFSGKLVLIDQGHLLVQEAAGRVRGIEVAVNADVILPLKKKKDEKDGKIARDRLIRAFLTELDRWSFAAEPPRLAIKLRGDLAEPTKLETKFSLRAEDLERDGYSLQEIACDGELAGPLLTLDHLMLRDKSGKASGRADWQMVDREGRFRLESDLHLTRMLRVCFGMNQFDRFSSEKVPRLKIEGTVRADEEKKWSVGATGEVSVGKCRVLGTDFESLQSNFSWQNGDLFLQDLTVKHLRGQLDGQIMLRAGVIRYEAKSTLPLSAFQPLIAPGSGLEKVLSRLEFNDSSVLALDAKGTINRKNLTEWESTGKAYATGVSYNSVPMNYLSADYVMSPLDSDFRRVSAQLADGENALARRFGAAGSQEMHADRITYNKEERLLNISKLQGTFWPASLVRMFNPKVAEFLETNIRLHQPPALVLDGVFDLVKPSKRSAYHISLNPNGPLDYTFLGKSLQVDKFRADLSVDDRVITLRDMSFQTLGSPFAGNIVVTLAPGEKAKFRGGMMWTRVALNEIGRKYGFKKEVAGDLTGRLDFSGVAGDARKLNGKGIVALERGELVSLPVLGPLSPLISGVLGDKKAGYEQARDASMTFNLTKGVLQTDDFITGSPSLILTGEGWADLAEKKLDMTVRVNAKGLLGLLTLPLKPFNGFFQFRGTGKLLEPKWNSAPFTAPTRGKKDPIFGNAERAQVVPE